MSRNRKRLKTKDKITLPLNTSIDRIVEDVDIRKLFCDLTTHTYPDGHEKEIFDKGILDIKQFQTDEFGNYFIKVGEDSNSMFTCHLDTATSYYGPVVHEVDGEFIKTDGKSILGADDKAGTVIMLYMIKHNIPGLYYFFLAEEVGCKGSKKLSEKWKTDKDAFGKINKVVAFDRKAYKSVITHQFGRTCSDEFAKDLSEKLNKLDTTFTFEPDPTGLSTDSAQFKSIIPECTNISVGYFDHHNMTEKQNIVFLEKLCKASIQIKWDELKVARDPLKDNDYGSSSHSRSTNYGYGYDSDYSSGYSRHTQNTGTSTYSKNTYSQDLTTEWWFDEKYQILTEINFKGGKIVSLALDKERIKFEERLIKDMLHLIEVNYKIVKWDGLKLEITSDLKESVSVLTREEMFEFVPEIDYLKV